LKNKGILFTAITFFLLVNTAYYWEGKLRSFAFHIFLFLVAVYASLVVALLWQIYLSVNEKFKQKDRFILIGVLATVLAVTYLNPSGLINFEKIEGTYVFIAVREGAANCMTTLNLKDDYTFTETASCFGVSIVKGTFRVASDTIYFDNVQLDKHEDSFYKFAVIKPPEFDNSKFFGDLKRYKDLTDTVGHVLWITKNDLKKLKGKKPNH
jgi:hypothetical protein